MQDDEAAKRSLSVWFFGVSFAEIAMASFKTPSTQIRFQKKTELFCSGYGYCPHYNAKNDHRKRSHSKTLFRVERFENDAFWKPCFLVWTEKTILFENGDVNKIDTTGRQTTQQWVVPDQSWSMDTLTWAPPQTCLTRPLICTEHTEVLEKKMRFVLEKSLKCTWKEWSQDCMYHAWIFDQ